MSNTASGVEEGLPTSLFTASLVPVAAALIVLVAALLTANPVLVYVAFGLAAVSLVLMAAGSLRRASHGARPSARVSAAPETAPAPPEAPAAMPRQQPAAPPQAEFAVPPPTAPTGAHPQDGSGAQEGRHDASAAGGERGLPVAPSPAGAAGESPASGGPEPIAAAGPTAGAYLRSPWDAGLFADAVAAAGPLAAHLGPDPAPPVLLPGPEDEEFLPVPGTEGEARRQALARRREAAAAAAAPEPQ